MAAKICSLTKIVAHLLKWWVAVGVGGQVVVNTIRDVLGQLVDVLPRTAFVFEAVPRRQKLYFVLFAHAPRQKIPQSKLAQGRVEPDE